MNKKEHTHLVLLDAHAILHRAYHALPDFSSSKGEPTGALYGFISMILAIAEELKPDAIAACYDLPGGTFRHEAYDAYKGGRKEAEGDLIMQMGTSRFVCDALGIPMYDAPSFEADDILGTIVEQVKNKDVVVTIASGDMDTLQLVEGDRVRVFTMRKGIKDIVLYNEEAVRERFGFAPEALIDYKGLRGDPSDNIPGVRGIGEKSATELIVAYGSLEKIFDALDQDGAEEVIKKSGAKKRMIDLLIAGRNDAEFSKTLATIRRDAPVTYELPEQSWTTSVSSEKIRELVSRFEFRSLLPRLERLFTEAELSPASHTSSSNMPTLSDREIQELAIGVWLLNSELTHPGEAEILEYTGEHNILKARDIILDHLNERGLMQVYKEIELPIIDVVAKMHEWGVKIDIPYLSELSQTYHKELDRMEKVIFEKAGKEFNIKSPKQLSDILFNHMKLPVVTTLGRIKKNASGDYSTKESELEKLTEEYPIIEDILHYRELQKLLSTYIDNLSRMVDKNDRLHGDLLQAGTSTGRFSSQNPNLQNIPIRSELGNNIRRAFVAEEGFVLCSCDYSQVELRCAAILSQDKDLVEIFQQGADVHTAVASRVFGVSPDHVSREMRAKAKVINFGIIYGMGVTALQKNLKSTRKEAQEFYNQYFERFTGIARYLESVKDFAYEHGYTETLFGRRRYYPGLRSSLPFIRAQAERFAINAPIQGTATADIIKLALRHVSEECEREGWGDSVRILLQIHDELLFEIREDMQDLVIPRIRRTMESVLENSWMKISTPIPLVVHAGIAKTWGSMKD